MVLLQCRRGNYSRTKAKTLLYLEYGREVHGQQWSSRPIEIACYVGVGYNSVASLLCGRYLRYGYVSRELRFGEYQYKITAKGLKFLRGARAFLREFPRFMHEIIEWQKYALPKLKKELSSSASSQKVAEHLNEMLKTQG